MFEDAYARIWDMMTRANGGKDWSTSHNLRYELSKLKLVMFSRCQVPNPGHPGKTMLEQCPDLTLQGTSINPSGLHKYWVSYLTRNCAGGNRWIMWW